MKILAIETSCDETAAAVVEDGVKIVSSALATSTLVHAKYGGVVPEIAAREQLKCIIPVITEALQSLGLQQDNNQAMKQFIDKEIDAIAVTVGPGLIGSLLVGVETAKTIAYVTGKPIIPVNHVLAHMYANFVLSSGEGQNSSRDQSRDNITHNQPSAISCQLSAINSKINSSKLKADSGRPIAFPAISLVVSGGHTELYLMKSEKDLIWLGGTLDDAAGEAFDKTARLLGFGNLGGIAIQNAAKNYEPKTMNCELKLPRPMMHDKTLNFSFSGLKTAALREVDKLKTTNQFNNKTIEQLAFEIQEAITDVLVYKSLNAVKVYEARSILLSGGVAANLRLREKTQSAIEQYDNVTLYVPEARLCTDNAVYIASYAYFRGKPVSWREIEAKPDLSVEI